jgi:protein-disulfide isomerase
MAKKTKKTPLTTQTHKERLRQQQEEARRKAARIRRIVVGSALALAVVVVVVFVLVAIQQGEKNAVMNSVTPPDANADKTALTVSADKAKEGVPTVGIYYDYQCENCATLESAIGQTLYDLAAAGDIKLEMHAMTFLDSDNDTKSSSRAAIAAACTDAVTTNEMYVAYHQAIFTNFPSETSGETEGYSDEMLMSVVPLAVQMTDDQKANLLTCFEEKKTNGFVEGVSQAAEQAGVSSTPTIRVNEKYYSGDGLNDLDTTDVIGWITSHAE